MAASVRLLARLRAAVGRRFPGWTRTIGIRGQSLRGPFGHQLDFYIRSYRFYDYFLPLLCRVVAENGSGGEIVDIGANIGDSILLIRQQAVANRVVAVEASPFFFGMLEHNVARAPQLFGDIRLVNAFVGSHDQRLVLSYTDGTAGTKVADAQTAASAVPTVSMQDLEVERAALVKIDTDGYDGVILESNLEYFHRSRPTIWAEAYVDSTDGLDAWTNALHGLVGHYQCFYLFDNAGRPVLSGALTAGAVAVLIQLVRAAWISRSLGAKGLGAAGVAYYDIALIPDESSGIWRDFQRAVSREVAQEAGVSLA